MNKKSRFTQLKKYTGNVTRYSSYSQPHKSANGSNGRPVIAAMMIKQSLVCIFIVLAVAWMQSSPEELPQKIISEVRQIVVETNVSPKDMVDAVAKQYTDYVEYLQGDS